jgi:hypothetical protein
MSNTDIEIVLDDPTASEADSPAVTSTGVVDVVVSLLLLAVAVTLGWDNWHTGDAWDSTGPQPGYFPFYLSVILGGASLYAWVWLSCRARKPRRFSSLGRSLPGLWRSSCPPSCSASPRNISGSMSLASS